MLAEAILLFDVNHIIDASKNFKLRVESCAAQH